ncbi:ScbR family autoregulator-binding transcription factor [Streptomyces sp. CA-111067]|uniref:ScbR family autoregulator-binding transcription factor n=1 Tax=Streptomyces sp. CA-111067 TaxID=3240046 RepID=UPI003D9777FC
MRQERAARTRSSLIRAAAAEFDRHGFAGASLSRISGTAEISTGALTFHFATKGELAAAVQQQGGLVTTRSVRRAAAAPEPAVQRVISLTLTLAALLQDETVVRAAARLSREAVVTGPDWTGLWMPYVSDLLAAAVRDGQLRPHVSSETVSAFVVHLVTGLEEGIRTQAGGPHAVGAVEELRNIWDLVMTGIARTDG